MNDKKLGRGLDALFVPPKAGSQAPGDTSMMPIDKMRPNPGQPRKTFQDEALRELADSIKSQGIIQPLLVRPLPRENAYQIVAGERRWRAAKLAGLAQVPVFVRQLSDAEVMAAALIENLQREDLNPIEEAEALQSLRESLSLTQDELAGRLGKSRSAVANALRLLQLSTAARKDMQEGRLSAGHGRCLLGIDSAEAAEKLRLRIHSHCLTVREAEEAAAFWRGNNTLPWEEDGQDSPQAPPARTGRKKDARLRALQKRLSADLGCKVSISGDASSGRIALAYTSSNELQSLLERLGVPPQENGQ